MRIVSKHSGNLLADENGSAWNIKLMMLTKK